MFRLEYLNRDAFIGVRWTDTGTKGGGESVDTTPKNVIEETERSACRDTYVPARRPSGGTSQGISPEDPPSGFSQRISPGDFAKGSPEGIPTWGAPGNPQASEDPPRGVFLGDPPRGEISNFTFFKGPEIMLDKSGFTKYSNPNRFKPNLMAGSRVTAIPCYGT